MSAWDALTLNSSAPSNSTAWTHINSLVGSGGIGVPFPVDTLEIVMEETPLQLVFTEDTFIANYVSEELLAVLAVETIEAFIAEGGTLVANIEDTGLNAQLALESININLTDSPLEVNIP